MAMRPRFLGAFFLVVICMLFVVPTAISAPPVLHRYSTGKRVAALQWLEAGHRPSKFRIKAYRGPINGRFNRALQRSTINLKYRLGWPTKRINGTAGPFFFNVLKGTTTRPFSYRLAAGKRVNSLARASGELQVTTLTGKIALLVSDAQYLIGVRDKVGYTQTALRMTIVRKKVHLPPLLQYLWEDCSSSVTGLYYLAGLPDPNGYTNPPYPGWGYTGTLAAHGRVVWRIGQSLSLLKPGDLIFYGGGWPHHHVTMYLGNGRVFSHGTNAGPFNLPVLYRGDAVGAHRYVTVG